WPSITTWDDSRNPNRPTSSAEETQIQGEAKAKIEALVEKYAPNVRLRHARRAPNKYRLDIED
ncbi:MAG: hypothetical protein WBY44_26545, partial [Bryobacteraceae bacterium]